MAEGAAHCGSCGISVEASSAPPTTPPIPPVVPVPPVGTYAPANDNNATGGSGFAEFIDFRKMVTSSIMKWYFIISSVLIVLGGLIILVSSFGLMANQWTFGQGIATFFLALIGTPFYLVLNRVMCEIIIIQFSIYREIKEINAKK